MNTFVYEEIDTNDPDYIKGFKEGAEIADNALGNHDYRQPAPEPEKVTISWGRISEFTTEFQLGFEAGVASRGCQYDRA
jgi:hypothetical protein